jgi:hypothetical protein
MARALLDTNVLVYADDADAGLKRAKAQALVVSGLTTGDAGATQRPDWSVVELSNGFLRQDTSAGVGTAPTPRPAEGLSSWRWCECHWRDDEEPPSPNPSEPPTLAVVRPG